MYLYQAQQTGPGFVNPADPEDSWDEDCDAFVAPSDYRQQQQQQHTGAQYCLPPASSFSLLPVSAHGLLWSSVTLPLCCLSLWWLFCLRAESAVSDCGHYGAVFLSCCVKMDESVWISANLTWPQSSYMKDWWNMYLHEVHSVRKPGTQ